MTLKLYDWQNDVLKCDTNIVLRSGRQVGKSLVIAYKCGEHAVRHANQSILVISHTEKQAYLLFSKILNYLVEFHRAKIRIGRDKPTKSEIYLTNGSIIRCLPTGISGTSLRGYTIDWLVADECAYIPEEVFIGVLPALSAAKKPRLILLSTPRGREGYFYSCFSDEDFTKFHISAETCPHINKDFLKKEKLRLSRARYLQEYIGEFTGDIGQLFPDALIHQRMTMRRREAITKGKDYYLGIDIARMGDDESTFEIFEKINDKFIQVDNLVTIKTHLTDTFQTILELENKYDFDKILIDDGGFGVAIYDMLLKDNRTYKKVIAINNSSRSIDREDKQHKRLLKEDLYSNLLALMEKGKIELLDDENLFFSLKSVQFEYTDDGTVKISGNNTHIAEGIIRAVWEGYNKKALKLWAR